MITLEEAQRALERVLALPSDCINSAVLLHK